MSRQRFLAKLNSQPLNRATIRRLVAERCDRNWCLFLDRDGVINDQVVGDYVRNWQQFQWRPGALAALKMLHEWAPHIVVVTNQQGVGKGLMSSDDVSAIHRRMQEKLYEHDISIESFQVCEHLESARCACRKPQGGLVLEWLTRNPDIEPALSIVVGDSQCDLELAANVKKTVGACTAIQIGRRTLDGTPDASFNTLHDFGIAVADSLREGCSQ